MKRRMDTEYEIDAAGNVVFVGLTADESTELVLLEAMQPIIEATIPFGGSDPGATIREKRKREMIEKHKAAVLLRAPPPNSTRH
jgi:hypothetical protein